MSVLIVGGTGHLGSNLGRYFAKVLDKKVVLYDLRPRSLGFLDEVINEESAVIVVGDVLDIAKISETVKRYDVQDVIYTAVAFQGNNRTSGTRANLYQAVKINLEGLLNVLEVSRLEDVRRVIFTSSRGVYGFRKVPPEGAYREEYPLDPIGPYCFQKVASENLGMQYKDIYGLEFASVRLAGPFGPAQVMPDLVSKLLGKVLSNEDYELSGPEGAREYCYVKDHCRGFGVLYKAKRLKYSTYNLGSGELTKDSEVVKLFKEIFPKVTLKFAPSSRRREPSFANLKAPCDIGRMKEEGWAPIYNLADGIRDFALWLDTGEYVDASP
jgi:nucleoside-diphosphate-sugar epimerase